MTGSTLKTQTDWNPSVFADLTDENGFIRFGSFIGSVPTDVNRFAEGSLLIKEDSGALYHNIGTPASPNIVQFTGGGGSIGGSIAINEIAYGSGPDTIIGDAGFTRDTITKYTNIQATVATGQTGYFQINNNLLGIGIKGIGSIYEDSGTGIYSFDAMGDATAIGLTASSHLIGITNLGSINGAIQFYNDGTITKQVFEVQDPSNSYSMELHSDTGLTLNATGSGYTFPHDDGSANQIMQTNGSGTLSWVDIPSSGNPGGSQYDVQVNGGSNTFYGDSTFTYDYSTMEMFVGNSSGASMNIYNVSSPEITVQMGQFIINDFTNQDTWFTTIVNGMGNFQGNWGDISGVGNGTRIGWDDVAMGVTLNAVGATTIAGSAISGHNVAIFNAGTNPRIQMGDIDSVGSTNTYVLDDTAGTMTFHTSANFIVNTGITNSQWFNVDTANKIVSAGDISLAYGMTVFSVVDGRKGFNFSNLQNFANNTAALAGGLLAGDIYYTNAAGDGLLKIVI